MMRVVSRLAIGSLACVLLSAVALGQATAEKKAEGKAKRPRPNTVVPVNRQDAWWMNRHNAMNDRVKKGNVDLLMIGDSITQGWEGAGKKAWDEFYGKRNAVNLGIGGDQTQHVLWRLQNGNIDGITPKLAVLMIGTNNTHANRPEDTARGIAAIVRTLNQKLPSMKILVLAVFPRGADANDAMRKVNDGVNERIQRLGRRENVTVLDIGAKFLEADGKLTKEIMPDLLHLSPKGYQIWAEAIEPEVAKVLGPK